MTQNTGLDGKQIFVCVPDELLPGCVSWSMLLIWPYLSFPNCKMKILVPIGKSCLKVKRAVKLDMLLYS